jgi:hypothetical protein
VVAELGFACGRLDSKRVELGWVGLAALGAWKFGSRPCRSAAERGWISRRIPDPTITVSDIFSGRLYGKTGLAGFKNNNENNVGFSKNQS